NATPYVAGKCRENREKSAPLSRFSSFSRLSWTNLSRFSCRRSVPHFAPFAIQRPLHTLRLCQPFPHQLDHRLIHPIAFALRQSQRVKDDGVERAAVGVNNFFRNGKYGS